MGGLTNDTPYSFEVRAVNSVGAGTAATASATPMQGICRRTAQVRDKLLDLIPSVTNCAVVTAAHLAAITGDSRGDLDLSSLGITALKAGDFAGVTGVTGLILNDNSLTSWPIGVFEGLDSVRFVSVRDNPLRSLTAGLFNGLDSLRNVDVGYNQLDSLAPDAFDGLDSLTNLFLNTTV